MASTTKEYFLGTNGLYIRTPWMFSDVIFASSVAERDRMLAVRLAGVTLLQFHDDEMAIRAYAGALDDYREWKESESDASRAAARGTTQLTLEAAADAESARDWHEAIGMRSSEEVARGLLEKGRTFFHLVVLGTLDEPANTTAFYRAAFSAQKPSE